MERWVESQKVHEGPVFSVWSGRAALDDGSIVPRDVVRHGRSVAVVPVLQRAVILVRQFRIAIERDIIEIPAGRIQEGEQPESAARRELEEETGYRTGKMVPGPRPQSSVCLTLKVQTNSKPPVFFRV